MSTNISALEPNPLTDRLRTLGARKGIRLISADYNTAAIQIAVEASHANPTSDEAIDDLSGLENEHASFTDILDEVQALELADDLHIQHVDFEANRIFIEFRANGSSRYYGLSHEEYEHILAGEVINAIKARRKRTKLGLADAKLVIEKARAKMRTDGLI